MKAVSILDALRDPDLFGRLPRFRSLGTWQAWLAFLAALFGEPLDDEALAVFQRHTGRSAPPPGGADEAAAIVGRRGGKSQTAALIAVFLATLRDWRPYLSAGERCHVVLIGQSQRAALRSLFGYCRGILRGVPVLARQIVAERSDEIDLANGVTLSIWPATFKATRGLTVAAAVLDEIDYWWQESINAAEEVVGALRPAMATLPGTKLIAISSPYTPTGWLHRFYREHWGQPDSSLVWKAPSRVMNPTLINAAARIAAAMVEDPERARSEWEAEWRSGVAALFEAVQLDACVRTEPAVIPPRDDRVYCGAVDPSGGGSDEFAWSVVDREGDRTVVDLVSARGRRGKLPLDLEEAVAACVADLKAYRIRECVGDRYAGAWIVEAFARAGVTYRHSEKTKSECFLDLLPLVTTRRVELPDDSELLRQAKLLERKHGAQGKDAVDHPPGGRDDRINAAALAVTQATVTERLFIHAAFNRTMGGGVDFESARRFGLVDESDPVEDYWTRAVEEARADAGRG